MKATSSKDHPIKASFARTIYRSWGKPMSATRQVMTIVLAATAFTWLLRLLIERNPTQGLWTLQVMLAIAALLAAVWDTIYRRQHWERPLDDLKAFVTQAREGTVPIDELSLIDGGIKPIVPAIQELLREIKQQRATIATLEGESKQRVATRNSALERVIGSLRHQATRDPLTGLFNRRFLDHYMPQAIDRCRNEGADACLLMVDVDNFKVLNDSLGHAAGDELLKAIGQLIRSTIRGEDVAFRCGGDEFVVLLPACDALAGRALADRLVSLVDALAKTIRVAPSPRLSIGLSSLKVLGDVKSDALMAEADRDLYRVKEERRASGHGGGANGHADRSCAKARGEGDLVRVAVSQNVNVSRE